MPKNELHAEVRVDSIGRSITRWVRSDKAASSGASIPQPMLEGSPAKAASQSQLDVSRMGTKWGRMKEKLTPGNAKLRKEHITNILIQSQAFFGYSKGGESIKSDISTPLLDAMSTQALGHLATALARDKDLVDASTLMQRFNTPLLDKFRDSAGEWFEFEVLNIEDLCARGAYGKIRSRTVEHINRLRESYDLFDRPDIFNMSEDDRNRAAEVVRVMSSMYLSYPDGKFPIRITHCILEHPGKADDIVDFLRERCGDGTITDDDADPLREYLNFPVTSLRDGVL